MQEVTISKEVLASAGFCACIYGEVGCGKTWSLLGLPDPLLLVSLEAKDIKRTIKEYMGVNKQKDRKIRIWEDFDDFEDLMAQLHALKQEYAEGKGVYKGIGFDSLSFAQQLFKLEMEDSRFGDRMAENKRANTFIDKFRMERGDWGGLKSAMVRLSRQLNSFSKHYGVYVVATAALTEYPKWNKALEAAPDFEGGYASVNAGFFDLVGVVKKDESKPDYPYPPLISFAEENAVTRCCSDTLMKGRQGVLDFQKIIEVLK